MLHYLRGWIGVVGLMALGNTISCFRDHEFMGERLYTAAQSDVNRLTARLFGVWTLLAALLRLYCAWHIYNRELYNITLVSFLLALGHFLSEAFFYKTAALGVGVLVPLAVSGFSTVWMLIGYSYLDEENAEPEKKKKR